MERYLRVNLLGLGHRLMKKKNLPGRGLTKVEKHCFRVAVTRLCINYHRILLLNGARFSFSSYNKRRCHINQLYQRLRPFLGDIIHSLTHTHIHMYIYRYQLRCSPCNSFRILTNTRILS